MAKAQGVLVVGVEPGSLAEGAGIRAGDRILFLQGEPVLDQLNYQFLVSSQDETEVVFQRPDGSRETVVLANEGDGLGVDLGQDGIKVCKQNCVFCFVHQMPKGYRKSLYLKDEDIRLSFLYGHFTTLRSSDEAEMDRVIRERLTPIHVSVHATNPEARVRIVGNPREGDILRKVDRLLEGRIDIHTQVVLAPGLNDGPIWEQTVEELWARRAHQTTGPWAGKGGVLSLSCVPVGLTAHREHLPVVPEVGPEYAQAWVRRWAPEVRVFRDRNEHEPWLLLADEWFTRAGLNLPGRNFYASDWAQIENGVGLIRRFQEHTMGFLRREKVQRFRGKHLLCLTGASFAPYLERELARVNRLTGSRLRAVAAPNYSFGTSVTVAGLLCGRDLEAAAHADRLDHGNRPDWVDAVVIPSASLRTHTGPTDQYTLAGGTAHPDTQFLDDMTLGQLQRALGVPVIPGGEHLGQLLDHFEAVTPRGMNQPQGAYNP